MDRNDIVKNAEMRVRRLYQKHFKPEFVYHNLEHTERVVKAAVQIAGYYQLDEMDEQAVFIAAWFHDTGYLFDFNDHEEKSAELAGLFLNTEMANPILIKKVNECILATRIFKKSLSLTAKIVSDADLFHLGTSDFWESNLRMKEEIERRFGKEIPEKKWHNSAIRLLKRHRFETEYCQILLKEGKQENMNRLWKWMKENPPKN